MKIPDKPWTVLCLTLWREKIKKTVPVVLVANLAFSSLSGCKPMTMTVPASSTGSNMGSVGLNTSISPEVLILSLQQNGFETIDGKTLKQALNDSPHAASFGDVALRDTTVKESNKFLVAVGSDTVTWYQSHDVSGKGRIADWETHVKKRIDLVKKLAAQKK